MHLSKVKRWVWHRQVLAEHTSMCDSINPAGVSSLIFYSAAVIPLSPLLGRSGVRSLKLETYIFLRDVTAPSVLSSRKTVDITKLLDNDQVN